MFRRSLIHLLVVLWKHPQEFGGRLYMRFRRLSSDNEHSSLFCQFTSDWTCDSDHRPGENRLYLRFRRLVKLGAPHRRLDFRFRRLDLSTRKPCNKLFITNCSVASTSSNCTVPQRRVDRPQLDHIARNRQIVDIWSYLNVLD